MVQANHLIDAIAGEIDISEGDVNYLSQNIAYMFSDVILFHI